MKRMNTFKASVRMKKRSKTALSVILIICVLMFSACSQKSERNFFAMDTVVNISAYCSPTLVEKAEARIKELDGKFSVTGEIGEVFLLNRDGVLNSPSAELTEILNCAKTLYERTGGAYDITSYPLKKLWQKCEKEGRMPTNEELNSALALVGTDKLIFADGKIMLGDAGGIDLGSVAKGYAGREAVKVLTDGGAERGILTLGGNIATFGKKADGGPYRIGITDPSDPENICGYVSVGQTNVVTSGGYNRYMTIGEEKFGHIIDARTGMPCANGVASVTVICDDGMWADALSTALFLLGEQGALEYYHTYGGFEAVIITDDGRTVTTSDAVDYVSLEK